MSHIHLFGRLALAAVAAAWLAPAPAHAQASKAHGLDAGDWSVHAGLGFTDDPDGFLVAPSFEYSLTRDFSVGPLLQLSFGDDDTIVAPTLNLRYRVDLSDVDNEFVRRIEPFAVLGPGFAYIDKDRRFGDDDDAGFLISGGFGADYWVTEDLAVGNTVLFNGMPDDVVNENFFFSWQVVSLRYRF
jgi:hypothetical protein